MGRILVDLVVRDEALPSPGGSVWIIDERVHVDGGSNALVAARRMGAEAVSLSPIGDGPYSSLIQAALIHEGITDLGPRVTGIDNGFCIASTNHTGECTSTSTKGTEAMAPASTWADFVCTMNLGDVLYVDGCLTDYPANYEAAEAAPCALPEGVHVVLDVSPIIRIPEGLPSDDIIVSMNHREAQEIIHQRGHASVCNRCNQPREAIQGVFIVLDRPVLVYARTEGACFVLPAGIAPNARNEDVIHVPTPRVEMIDTDGAGDAHSGVLVASLVRGTPTGQAPLLANRVGALPTTVVGPVSYPMREEIKATANALEANNDEK